MFKTLHKTKLAVALTAALGAAAMVPQAQAVNISGDGLGDLLFFPYYTVRDGWNTYFHLTNTSDRTAILKVRWREARNSREVRDFNLILSPHDVWVAAITPNAAGDGTMMKTDDKSCTSPQLPSVGGVFTGIDFTNAGYNGQIPALPWDGGPTGMDRTKEGYFEVFLMALSTIPEAAGFPPGSIESNSQHVAGVPRDCAAVAAAFQGAIGVGVGEFATFGLPGNPPNRNVIAGNSTLINVGNGQAVGVEPTTMANCLVNEIFLPGDQEPNAANCLFTNMWILDDNEASGDPTGGLVTDVFLTGQDAVSAALMRSSVINEWTTAAATNALTDWVVTFPTKHFYTDGVLLNPFHEQFDAPIAGQSCDPVGIHVWDREEKTTVGDVPFSPVIPGEQTELCNEVNVITWNSSNVLGSLVQRNVSTASIGDKGWANIDLVDLNVVGPSTQLIGVNGTTFAGLPTIGFAVTVRNNPVVAGNNRNYASAHDHKYRRLVNPIN